MDLNDRLGLRSYLTLVMRTHMTQGLYTTSNMSHRPTVKQHFYLNLLSLTAALWTNTLKSWAIPWPQAAGAWRTTINLWEVAIETPVQLTPVHPSFPLLKCALPPSVPHYLLLLTGLRYLGGVEDRARRKHCRYTIILGRQDLTTWYHQEKTRYKFRPVSSLLWKIYNWNQLFSLNSEAPFRLIH